MNAGERIGVLAKERNINLHQLAVKADVPYSTVYALVSRKSKRIESVTLEKLVAALAVSAGDITGYYPQESIESNEDMDAIVSANPDCPSVEASQINQLEARQMNTEKIEQVITELISVSGILEALAETADSPLSEAIWGTQDYLDRIIEELCDAIE